MKKLILLTLCLLYGLTALCQSQLEQGKQYYNWQDYARALPLLQQSAKEGYGEACYLLGNMYYYGYGTEINYQIAMRMYQRGLEFGYNYGNAELGRMYENGDGCTKDPEKAFSFYLKSNSTDDKLGQYLLGRCYMFGIGTDHDLDRAYTIFSSLYNDSYFRKEYYWAYQWTCTFLGQCCEFGWGTNKDLDAAVDFYSKSEMPDYLYHASRLARLYSLGMSDRWKSLLRTAVWNGIDDGRALYEYVQLKLEEGNGAIDSKTFNYLVQAADTYPPALKLLGDCYRLGHGTAINLMKARECYDKAEANSEAIQKIETEEQAEKERAAVEKERIAAEKQAEKERIAAEKRAEEQRIAAEKRAEEQRIAAEKRRIEQKKNEARRAAAARYKEGDIYLEDGKGVVVKHSEQGVLIVTTSNYFGPWPGQYPNNDGWRLPTRAELRYILSNRDLVNRYLGAHSCGQIRSGVYYWSAEQGYRSNECIASNGSEISRDRSNKNYVLLVREY